jgi:uncharacterized membrane protein (DUF106 family)
LQEGALRLYVMQWSYLPSPAGRLRFIIKQVAPLVYRVILCIIYWAYAVVHQGRRKAQTHYHWVLSSLLRRLYHIFSFSRVACAATIDLW